MGLFDSIFKGAKRDDNVDKLFQEANPIERPTVAVQKSVKPIIPANNESSEESSESSDDEEEQPKKKKVKRDENFDLEARYFDKLLKEDNKDKEETKKTNASDESDAEADAEAKSDSESKPDSKPQKGAAAKVVDLKETELEKAQRTVFVGNVPITVVTSKPIYKKFKQLFEVVGEIDSIRFRSISFDEALPRKIAFAHKLFHQSRQNLNAYIVFKSKDASRKAGELLNASTFENFHLRVDHVTHPSPRDNKRSIFVGNLDFEEQEETLWGYFNKHTNDDVESVRVVRDSKTNLGKGFAIVQFKDTLSVNKTLMLNDKPINEKSKRKLRISRVKHNAKPSVLSPNHVDNLRNQSKSKKMERVSSTLNDKQRTQLGRVKSLGKADNATIGKTKVILEGERAKKNGSGKKNLKAKKPRHKKPRIRDRSTKFKENLKAQDQAKK